MRIKCLAGKFNSGSDKTEQEIKLYRKIKIIITTKEVSLHMQYLLDADA